MSAPGGIGISGFDCNYSTTLLMARQVALQRNVKIAQVLDEVCGCRNELLSVGMLCGTCSALPDAISQVTLGTSLPWEFPKFNIEAMISQHSYARCLKPLPPSANGSFVELSTRNRHLSAAINASLVRL